MVLKLLLPMAFMMLLWISTFVSANYLLTTTVDSQQAELILFRDQ